MLKCYRKLETSVNNLRRLINKRKLQKSGSNNQAVLRESKRLSRYCLECIFFQLDKNVKLHALGTNKKLEEKETVN